MQLAVYVYGNGEVIQEYFKAIAATMGHSHYATAIRISLLLAGATVLFQYMMRRNLMDILRWVLLYYLVLYVIFAPKVTVIIQDRVNQPRMFAVDKVPFGVAVLAHYTTALGAALTEMTEATFTMLGDLRYGRSGMVMASRLIAATSTFQIPHPIFNENMQTFVQQCVFYDLFLNKYTLADLERNNDLWEFMKTKASPARMFPYLPLSGGNASLQTCREGVPLLQKDWETVLIEAKRLYGARFFPSNPDPAKQFELYLPNSYSYLLKASRTASQILQQSMVANTISNSAMRFSTTADAPAALQAFISAKTHLQERLTYRTIGERAAHWLPLLKNGLEATMYGAFVIVMLLLMFPFGAAVLRQYAFSLVWLQAWAPLYAIINLMVSYYAQQSTSAHTRGNMTLHNLDGIFSINADMAALAGYLSLSVPMLAFGLVRGFGGAMSSMAQYVGGLTQSISTQVAGEAAAGNISLGNTSFDNHSSSNLSSNHVDTMSRVVSGGMSLQMSGGSSLTMTPSGSIVLNTSGALSNLGVSINFADNFRATYMQQADASYQAGLNENKNYQQSVTDALRSIHDLAGTQGKAQSSGEAASLSNSSSFNEAASVINKFSNDLSEKHGLTKAEASDVISSARAAGNLGLQGSAKADFVSKAVPGSDDLPISAGGSVSASAGLDGSLGRSSSDTRSINKDAVIADAISIANDQQYQNAIEIAGRAAQESHFNASTNEGQQLTKNFNAALDKAKQASEAMNAHFQKSESYKQQASFAQENSVHINTQGNQAFRNWVTNQPGTDGRGRLGDSGVAYLAANEPQTLAAFAKKFVAEQSGQLSQGWNKNLPGSSATVSAAHERNKQGISSSAAVESGHQNNQAQVNQLAGQQGLGQGSIVDTSIKERVGTYRDSAKKQMETRKEVLHEKSSPAAKEIHEKSKAPIEDLTILSDVRKK